MRSILVILFVSLACVCSAPAIPGICKSSMFQLWMYLSQITSSVTTFSSLTSYGLHSSHTIPIALHSCTVIICLTYFQRKRQRLLKVTSTRSLTNYLLKQTYHDSIPAKSIVGVVIYNWTSNRFSNDWNHLHILLLDVTENFLKIATINFENQK